MALLKITFLFFVCYCYCNSTIAQKQLLLLKRGNIVHYYLPGDDFVFKLKGEKTVRTSYVNNLSDTAVVTHRDTIPFHKIDKLYFSRFTLANKLGAVLLIGGAGLFVIDQFNVVVVQGNKASLDDHVNRLSLSGVALGLPLFIIRKKSQRIRFKYNLRTVAVGSPLYQGR